MKPPVHLPPNPPALPVLSAFQKIVLKACPPNMMFTAKDVEKYGSQTAGFPPPRAISQHLLRLWENRLMVRFPGKEGKLFQLTAEGRRLRSLLLKAKPA